MPRVEALLCDIDGTLVESNWLHAESWQRSFAEIGIDLELDAVRRQIGKGGDELIPVFVSWWRARVVEEPLKAYRKFLFQSEYLQQVKPLPRARSSWSGLKRPESGRRSQPRRAPRISRPTRKLLAWNT